MAERFGDPPSDREWITELSAQLQDAQAQRDRLLEAARTLVPYTLGFSENRAVAEAKETINEMTGEQDKAGRDA